MMNEFYLPDLGEGLQDAELVEWKVKEGDSVDVDQLMVIVETAKAIVEIPCPVNAKVVKILVAPGESVKVGAAMMQYEKSHQEKMSTATQSKESSETACNQETGDASIESVSVVGSLKRAGDEQGADLFETIVDDLEASVRAPTMNADRRRTSKGYRYSPAIVAFAEKLGLGQYLNDTHDDDLSQSKLLAIYQQQGGRVKEVLCAPEGDAVVKLSSTRKVMAQTMSRSHEQIPAVTLFDDADISDWNQGEDITLRAIKAVVDACRVVPLLNAWFDEEKMSVQTFSDIHLGVAVNAKDGLFVPVLRSVQSLRQETVRDILNKQRQAIEARRIKPQKLLGATITLSNFGTLGGRYATPIIVPPQVAIIGLGAIRREPLVKSGVIQAGKVAPISLSFDHRAATGAEAASFMNALIESLQRVS